MRKNYLIVINVFKSKKIKLLIYKYHLSLIFSDKLLFKTVGDLFSSFYFPFGDKDI